MHSTPRTGLRDHGPRFRTPSGCGPPGPEPESVPHLIAHPYFTFPHANRLWALGPTNGELAITTVCDYRPSAPPTPLALLLGLGLLYLLDPGALRLPVLAATPQITAAVGF
jgi:hypothetical protein